MGSKPFWKSLGVLGSIATVLLVGAEGTGYLPSGTQTSIAEALGALVALYGRIRAKDKVTLLAPRGRRPRIA